MLLARTTSSSENPFAGVSGYRTPAHKRPTLLGGLFPTLTFYHHMTRIVYRSSKLAAAGVYDGEKWVESSLAIFKALENVGVRFDVRGLERVEKLGMPVVYAANHMSTLETFLLPSMLMPKGKITFVVKESLLKYPWFGDVIRARDPIAVGRTNPREDLTRVMGEGAAKLSEGTSVVVFPQTTRAAAFEPEKFNSIGAKLAARAKVPLVPLALHTGAWSTGRFVKDFGPIKPKLTVEFSFGEPLPPQGKGDEAHKATVEFLAQAFANRERTGTLFGR